MPTYPPCDFCGSEKVFNPKTGKVFCKAKCWLNKQAKVVKQSEQKFDEELENTKEEEKWKQISLGKCRYGFLIEAFKLGLPLNQETIETCNNWAKVAMTGNK